MAVEMLWTGGWDSTFRLLDLTITQGREVQPHYVRDELRRSTGAELAAMDRILDALRAQYPEAAMRVRPVDSSATVASLPPDEVVTASLARLKEHGHLGDQYEWLARFAAEREIDGLELSIHRDDRAAGFLDGHVYVDGDAHVLEDDPSNPDLAIFGRFRFPLFDITKVQMQGIATAAGWAHLLELTWFCHRPERGKPCGLCAPCRYTREEGLGRRVPSGRVTSARRQGRRLARRVRRTMERAVRPDTSR